MVRPDERGFDHPAVGATAESSRRERASRYAQRPLSSTGVGSDNGWHLSDTDGFADVVAAERDRALRLAFLLAGDRDAAEDALAEAFARTYEKWQAGKVDDVGPYLRRAVHNQVKNQRRSLARLRRHEQRRRADDRGAVTPADRAAARDTVVDLLERLPYRQRVAVVLRYYEDCSEAEVAEALGCRPGTVKSLVSRAMGTLREQAVEAGLDG